MIGKFRSARLFSDSSIMIPEYVVRRAPEHLPLDANWEDPSWARAERAEIDQFRPEGSDHHPRTSIRLLCSELGIHGIFRVEDRYVRCVRTNYLDEVWKDSCVEFFAQPKPDRGYYNFEFNCGGAFLCSYIVNPERTPEGFKEFTKVPAAIGKTIRVRSSLPPRIEPEIQEPTVWTLQFFIPFSLFENFVGPIGKIQGQMWRGNFFKCAEEVSHPHWASWSPVDRFDFHRPQCFGSIRFSPD